MKLQPARITLTPSRSIIAVEAAIQREMSQHLFARARRMAEQREAQRTITAIRGMGYTTEQMLYLVGDAYYDEQWKTQIHDSPTRGW